MSRLRAATTGDTIPARLARSAAAVGATVAFVDGSGRDEETDTRAIERSASVIARRLRARGVRRGDRIAFIGFTTRPLLEAILGAWQAGAAVAMLPIPLRLKEPQALAAHTKRLVDSARVKLVVADAFFEDALAGLATAAPLLPLAALGEGDEAPSDDTPLPSDLALLQLTSGSSGAPKAVCLTHAALCANIDSIADATQLSSRDHVCTWLPLYHDMGLIGAMLAPLLVGSALSMMSPHAFMLRPSTWMDMASRRKATVLVGPNFAYALAAKALARAQGLDLSRLRLAFCGAEPIVPADVESFLEAGRPHGMPATILLPCYGLAEAALGVAIAPPARHLLVDRVARTALERDRRALPAAEGEPAKEVVGVGRALRAMAVRVVDADGADLPERVVGEVWIAGASLLSHYEIAGDVVVPLQHGWLRTGDLGYLVGGELFICGRMKDLMIVRGRNLWPDDVERVAESVVGVRRGNACAFGVDDESGHETIVLVAERGRDTERPGVAEEVLAAITESIGVAPRHVLLLEPSALPKTSSGKLRRQVTKTSYLEGTLAPVEEAGLALRRAGDTP